MSEVRNLNTSLQQPVSLDTAAGIIARAFQRALREGYRPVTFGVLGQPGIGKTAFVGDMCRQRWRHLSIPMATKEPQDLQGLVSLDPKDPRYFIYRAPEWSKGLLAGECATPTVVVLDDFPHAQKQVQAGSFKLVHEGQFSDNLPFDNQVMFVLTGNRLEDMAGAGQILSPLRSRVRWLYVEPSLDEWLARCAQWNINFKVRAWVYQQTQYFCKYTASAFAYPCPRSHHMLSVAQHEHDEAGTKLTMAEAEGIEGGEAAAQYLQFCKAESDLVDPRKVLEDPTGVRVNTRNVDAFVMLVKSLETLVEANPADNWEPVVQFAVRSDLTMGDLLASLGNKAITTAINKGASSTWVNIGRGKTFKAYMERFRNNAQAETIARQMAKEGGL